MYFFYSGQSNWLFNNSNNLNRIKSTGFSAIGMVPEELIWCGSAVHQSVSNHRSRVTDWNADGVFRLLQDQHVTLVVADQELQVEFDAQVSAKNCNQTVQPAFLQLIGFILRERWNKNNMSISHIQSKIQCQRLYPITELLISNDCIWEVSNWIQLTMNIPSRVKDRIVHSPAWVPFWFLWPLRSFHYQEQLCDQFIQKLINIQKAMELKVPSHNLSGITYENDNNKE